MSVLTTDEPAKTYTPMVQPRATITDHLTQAIAQATGLKAEQILAVTADAEVTRVLYHGPSAGMAGGHGRVAEQAWDTQTGKMLYDETVPGRLATAKA
ncbi:hypothetical protein [Kribbella deserti]|uniref:Uncharacterized protein n=1 Tax=Kribbella deserti TaxID=1926257 RepID=A0ABV6QND6_9ACTN